MATSKNVHASKKELISEQEQHIINKLQARTSLLVEQLPVVKDDNRDPWFAKYEAEHWDNPKSAAYQKRDVALVAAIAAGVSTEDFNLRTTVSYLLSYRRGVVFVLQNSKLFSWDEYPDYNEGDILVCTGEDAGLFQKVEQTKGAKMELTTANARYATDKEIEAFVNEAIKTRPMHFIKQLGDASELEALGK